MTETHSPTSSEKTKNLYLGNCVKALKPAFDATSLLSAKNCSSKS